MRAGVQKGSAGVGPAGERGAVRARGGRWARAAAALAGSLILILSVPACAVDGGGEDAPAATGRTALLERSRDRFALAAEALRSHDRAAFVAALPAAGRLRERIDAVYETLSPLPWTSFGFSLEPLPGHAGVYRVVGSGRLGDAGPDDRLAVVRYLRLSGEADGITVSGDETPEELRRRYLMALHDPVVLRRPGFVVLADGWARDRARTVAAAAVAARPRLEALGLDTGPDVVVTVYGSGEDVRDALAVNLPTARLRFFAHAPLRVAHETWSIDDVGVMGPWLRDPGESIDGVLVHELAHAYSVRWFEDDERPPALLVEGIAAAAEGASVSPALRDEVASGNQLWPLPESFAVDDVWDGGDGEAVGLGYEVGGALVDYVSARWGASRLEPFVRAVAAAEATEAGLDAALDEALGVGWDEFYAGWRRFVLRGG